MTGVCHIQLQSISLERVCYIYFPENEIRDSQAVLRIELLIQILSTVSNCGSTWFYSLDIVYHLNHTD